ncbi:hypothetical protein I302_104290 [Kwoniella bestiolae CBS 10118]|uniref:Uncharacterized protein n=1 Tax=Kwoniella bestiolae CBS 10118 TaxID=1296100 RepID=A0A1B9GAV1_9TREE|nr:hypothetical protein I302_02997 [Kwoniella bestiolae CBS 10118]OCF28146.1 hypothetical protein I302_02997 [Kwoniella bestiolae CBS 10118]
MSVSAQDDEKVKLSILAARGTGYYDENDVLQRGPEHSMTVEWKSDQIGHTTKKIRVVIYEDEDSDVIRNDVYCYAGPLLYEEHQAASYNFSTKMDEPYVTAEVHRVDIALLTCFGHDDRIVRFDSTPSGMDATEHLCFPSLL